MKEQLPTMTEMLERVDVEEDLEKTDGVIENLVAEVAHQGGEEEEVEGQGDHSNLVDEIDPTDLVEETEMLQTPQL